MQELIDDAYRKAYSKANKNTGRAGEMERLEAEVVRLKEDKQRAVLYKSISKYSSWCTPVPSLMKIHPGVLEISRLRGKNSIFRPSSLTFDLGRISPEI